MVRLMCGGMREATRHREEEAGVSGTKEVLNN